MAGIRVIQKRNNALKKLKLSLKDDNYFRSILPLVSKAIDLYILESGGSRCINCFEVISCSSKSGYCRRCYNANYLKTDKGKEKKRRYNKKRYEKFKATHKESLHEFINANRQHN